MKLQRYSKIMDVHTDKEGLRVFTAHEPDGCVYKIRENNNFYSTRRLKPDYQGPLLGSDRWFADYSCYGLAPSRARQDPPHKELLRMENEALAKQDWPLIAQCKHERMLRDRKDLFDDEWERTGKRPDASWDLPNSSGMKENIDNPAFIKWMLTDNPEGEKALGMIKKMVTENISDA